MDGCKQEWFTDQNILAFVLGCGETGDDCQRTTGEIHEEWDGSHRIDTNYCTAEMPVPQKFVSANTTGVPPIEATLDYLYLTFWRKMSRCTIPYLEAIVWESELEARAELQLGVGSGGGWYSVALSMVWLRGCGSLTGLKGH